MDILVAAVPTIVTVLVCLALHGRRSSRYVAWGLIGLLSAFCLLGVLSIGIFVLPVALLLASAARLTPASHRSGQPATPYDHEASAAAPGVLSVLMSRRP